MISESETKQQNIHSKSIILFGKGPSVLNCTKQLVDVFNDVAICNYPYRGDDYEKYISNRATIHYCSLSVPDERYTPEIIRKLGIKEIYGTGNYKSANCSTYIKRFKLTDIYCCHLREKYEVYFKTNHDLDPSTGALALFHIVDSGRYNKICVVGFDNYKVGDQVYYHPFEKANPHLKYIQRLNIVTKEGKQNKPSGHNSEKTLTFIEWLIDTNPHIQFQFITNMHFKNQHSNLVILSQSDVQSICESASKS